MDNEEEVINTDPMAEEKVLLKEYQKLKDNTVSKEKYEKDIKALEEKNALYLKAITDGEKVDVPSEEDSGSVIDTIADLSKFRGTNLEYWKKTTKKRGCEWSQPRSFFLARAQGNSLSIHGKTPFFQLHFFVDKHPSLRFASYVNTKRFQRLFVHVRKHNGGVQFAIPQFI